ncbi:saccharopine dehydrogenase family protein [Microbacterium sp. SA39]|uniref:saccharopine dehydrogenase family protein n=1 Tax=Microbacterium sp. SA39 TaxID=1263625 RepID=UPI00061E08B5|nr:saccharopine dehydrogenase NADP-binding domain-containing protein [Microbacterium sp. SA39]KJQ52698.1 putative trans-acting enoyl reductase [Microbacterium sp. SA39]
MNREFDLVVFGATGFTGRRAAEYIRDHAPAGLRWAVAGRNAERLAQLETGAAVVVADATDPAQLTALAARTRVVLNMAGPFRQFGDPLVDACVDEGTHYIDISGEVSRIRELIDRHHAVATRKGVAIVPFGGVSSTPADIAAAVADQRLGGLLHTASLIVRIRGGMFNGGTVASMIEASENGDDAEERDPLLLGPEGRTPRPGEKDPRGMTFDRRLRAWLVPSPMGVSDTRAIRLASSLRGQDVTVQEHLAFDGWAGLFPAVQLQAGLAVIAALLKFRRGRALLSRLVPPGNGPSEEQIAQGFYRLDLHGMDARGSETVVHVSGAGDPANRITVTSAAEIALNMADPAAPVPLRGGVVPPSIALGASFAERLTSAGIIFD